MTISQTLSHLLQKEKILKCKQTRVTMITFVTKSSWACLSAMTIKCLHTAWFPVYWQSRHLTRKTTSSSFKLIRFALETKSQCLIRLPRISAS